ncbi:uncharacterized protein HMPREF1541_04253 [Cyphellophora europaea CBS 101466]|uniref:Helicase ATP-binding domain-containing protein n=1 Tax=Cyphellophora europaea (strain CBS 101466) TaxID=1220924 RepID=W2RW45_CYPE1|nr:uncharacterized protein HMPREF1541_04253 [Cyphellophora europaea CBS 101466]ETN39978.1 hypothetical protein HMPREF1541_04253 [Cyphellophora europaea CBS 101466]
MFERSMLENIIVAMDTGSGKTHVALLRIRAELERSPCTKSLIVWFLAPHVELCNQQYRELCKGLPATKIKLLVGSDNVHRWSEQSIWDAALDHVRLVISTHKILEDALAHNFVKLETLSLLVFDEEAHHCVRKHPANAIMQRFYHPRRMKLGFDSVPHILGLTASPIQSKLKQLK